MALHWAIEFILQIWRTEIWVPLHSFEYIFPFDCITMTTPSCYSLLTSISPAWINNHMPGKVWDDITYPFPTSTVVPLKFGIDK